jgi:Cu(I)/Ag(I) efflux system membrane protein CusA/SilA
MKFKQAVLAAVTALSAAVAIAQAALPFVDAQVKRVDAGKGTIVLAHKDIPNLGMSGMTMQFDVANKKLLDGVKPGDKVQFTADMEGGKPVVQALRPAK